MNLYYQERFQKALLARCKRQDLRLLNGEIVVDLLLKITLFAICQAMRIKFLGDDRFLCLSVKANLADSVIFLLQWLLSLFGVWSYIIVPRHLRDLCPAFTEFHKILKNHVRYFLQVKNVICYCWKMFAFYLKH